MKKLLISCITNIFVLNIPIIISNIFKLGNNDSFKYFSESVQGIIMFYIAVYGLDKMKQYAVDHSQYKDKYEKTITKERTNLFIKFLSSIQILFSIMLVAVPLSLLNYIDRNSGTLIIFIISFIISFIIGLSYIIKIKKKVYTGEENGQK